MLTLESPTGTRFARRAQAASRGVKQGEEPMTELVRWRRPSMLGLQRDVEDILDHFGSPRAFRREIERLFDEPATAPILWREVDRLFEEFESPRPLRKRMSRLFDDFAETMRRPFGRAPETFIPSVDLVERDNEYVMKADLPGMKEQDIELSVDQNNVLTISGERREEETKRERGYEYTERSYGRFSRSASLPAGADTSKIQADFRNGVLEVHIPKTEAVGAGKIPVAGEQPRVHAAGNGAGPGAQKEQPRVG
jgi:HSP20 family protein